MIGLEPMVTVHSGTGAFRRVTSDFLAEAYLAPHPTPVDLSEVLKDGAFPWSASMDVAPLETTIAVSSALRNVAMATQDLNPDEIDLAGLDTESRLYRHLAALRELWRQAPAALPEDLQHYAHVLQCSASDALEPVPLLTAEPSLYAAPIMRRLQGHLLDHHGLADEAARREWASRHAPLSNGAPEGTSLWRVQRGLTGASIPSGPLDDTLQFFAVRDEAEEADFAAARAQRWIDQGLSPAEIGILIPDEVGYSAHLRRAFDSTGVPLSGLPIPPDRRDIAGETLLHLLLCFQMPAPAMALASLYISPLMPWSAETGLQLSREVMRGRFDPTAARSLSGPGQRLCRHDLRRGTPAADQTGNPRGPVVGGGLRHHR